MNIIYNLKEIASFLKKAFFAPLTQALDVGSMGIKNEPSQEQAYWKEEFQIRRPPVKEGDHYGEDNGGYK